MTSSPYMFNVVQGRVSKAHIKRLDALLSDIGVTAYAAEGRVWLACRSYGHGVDKAREADANALIASRGWTMLASRPD